MIQKPKTAEPPQNVETELALVGSVIINPTAMDIVQTIVTSEDFLDDGLRKFWGILSVMAEGGKAINDPLLIRQEAVRMGLFDAIGGTLGIAKAFQSVPHSSHAVHYANIVAAKSALRRQATIATKLLERATDHGADPLDNRQWAEAQLAAVGQNAVSSVRSVGEIAFESIAAMELDLATAHKPGVMTGLYGYDQCFGSLMCGELTILAARPSIGKTALGLQIAENAALNDQRALVVSLEMKDRELVDRMLAKYSGVDGRKIRARKLNDENMRALRGSAITLNDIPLFVWDPSTSSASQIRGVARLEHARRKIELLVVDYIGLVKPADRTRQRHEQIGEVTATLKALAKELGIPIIALCQLNREAETNRPHLANLKDSGSIEQDADVVIFLHKEERYSASQDPNRTQSVELIVAKNRNGDTGKLMLGWEPVATRFFDPNAPKPFGEFNEYNNR